MLSGTFSARAYSFFDTLLWIACLNMLWIVFTLLGMGVLGAGPATAAAQILVRKRASGDQAPLLRSFAAEYFRNFGRANILALPVMGIAMALVMNWNFYSGSNGLAANLMTAGIFVAAIFLAGSACYIFPLYARYDLPLVQYFLTSSRFALRHLAGTVILLFVSAAAVYASSAVPGLITLRKLPPPDPAARAEAALPPSSMKRINHQARTFPLDPEEVEKEHHDP